MTDKTPSKRNIKIMWVTLRLFSNELEKKTGVWLKSLALEISKNEEYILCNVTSDPKAKKFASFDFENIKQWNIPISKINSNGYPDSIASNNFEFVYNNFKPDILCVWGSENPFCKLPFHKKFDCIKILYMQGVISSIPDVLFSGLSYLDLLSTIGIREILTFKSIYSTMSQFRKLGNHEKEMVKKSPVIVTQSEWTYSQIRHLNPNAHYFKTSRVLRSEFYTCKKWNEFSHAEPIIYSAAIGYSLKGLHILVKALSLVKINYPNIKLYLAGATGRLDLFADGYIKFILILAKKLNVIENISFLGPLDASESINMYQCASIFVNPSYIESYSMVVAEAMYVGTPVVSAYSGAIPELADNNCEALFFTPGDYKNLSFLITSILSNPALASRLSSCAIKRSYVNNNIDEILKTNLDIYRSLL